MLKSEGHNVHFIAETLERKTSDFFVSGRLTDVKRISGLGRQFAGDLARGVEQVGSGGQIIVVRPSDSRFNIDQYRDFVGNFKPKYPGIDIRVVEEAELPPLKVDSDARRR